MDIIEKIGAPFSHRLTSLFNFGYFVSETIASFFRNVRYGRRLLFRNAAFQVLFTAVDAVPIVTLLSIFIFSAIVKQVGTYVPQSGAGLFLGKMFVILIIRELAPIIISFVVIARSGTAIAAELSSMMVHEEISSLKVLGIDPLYFIVIPRVVGITVSILCLSMFFTVLTIVGGMLLANYYFAVPLHQFLEGVLDNMTPLDVLINILKSVLFGLTISGLCCYYGLSTKYSPTEIPQMTTKAVINSMICCFVFSAAITLVYY
ncbi:MAG TPA: ABC transporter permease [bacterium]|nr:ABC transporter permease [bacterium]